MESIFVISWPCSITPSTTYLVFLWATLVKNASNPFVNIKKPAKTTSEL